MKSFLQIENLTKSFGDRVLFSDVTFGIYEGDKIGLIAKNGSGKTTLLRIIAGEESYDSGSLVFRNDLRVGYLKQLPELDPNLSVIEACLSIDDEPTAAIRTYERALASGDADALAKAMSQMDAAGAWDYEDRIRQTLTQLTHHGIRFFDTAEISCTAQPTGGIERGINCKFGKMFLDAGSYRISFVLGLTGIIPCINLYAVTRTFNHFLLIRTGRNILRTYQCRNACILMDSHLALSRHITFQAFHNIILRYRNRCKSETCN
jgi:hypothetical protein